MNTGHETLAELFVTGWCVWIPAFAGMTGRVARLVGQCPSEARGPKNASGTGSRPRAGGYPMPKPGIRDRFSWAAAMGARRFDALATAG